MTESVASYLKDQKSACHLILLNVYYPPVGNFPSNQLLQRHDEVRKQSLAGLEKELQHLQKSVANPMVSYEILSHMGDSENVIRHLIKDKNIHTLIMAEGLNGRKAKMTNIECTLLLVTAPA